MNLLALHFNSNEGTFVDVSNLSGGNVQQGTTITTFNAGYTLAILKLVGNEFAGTSLESAVSNAINSQANFLFNNLSDGNGKFYNSYTIGPGVDSSSTLVKTQAAAVRGLLAAYQATGDSNFLDAADKGYNYLITKFYVPKVNAFRTTEGNDLATYTPLNFASLSGALRESRLVLNKQDAPIIYKILHYGRK